MKKNIVAVVALLFLCIGTYAQAGKLKIINNNKKCGVYVVMKAEAPGYPAGALCKLDANQVYLAPLTTKVWHHPHNFAQPPMGASAAPVGYISNPLTPAQWTYITPAHNKGFEYTDVSFQWNCPSGYCTDAGGSMSESTSLLISCLGLPATWTGIGGCTGGKWTQTLPAGTPMNNVTLTFH